MKKKILFALCLLFGLLFINAGLNKFFNYMPVPDDMPETSIKMFMAMMEIKWLMPLIAVAEITGGILFIIPRYRALGAIIIFPVMAGIVLTELSTNTGSLPIILPLVAILIWVMYENRHKYLPMVS